jgi:nitroreductase
MINASVTIVPLTVWHHIKAIPLNGVSVPEAEAETTTAASSVSEALLSRHSCRAFTDRPVDNATIRQLLDAARFAPSGGNLQPWLVHVLSGDSLQRFRTLLTPLVQADPLGGLAEYPVYPPELKEPYRSRRSTSGEDMYGHIGIRREDREARRRQFARNFEFFGAPVGMFFFVDRSMGPPQWSDIGMFMQSIMLLARERGLETCAQESWAIRHKEITEFLKVDSTLMLFCGMAVGYGDYAAPINRLRTARAEVEEFAVFHD